MKSYHGLTASWKLARLAGVMVVAYLAVDWYTMTRARQEESASAPSPTPTPLDVVDALGAIRQGIKMCMIDERLAGGAEHACQICREEFMVMVHDRYPRQGRDRYLIDEYLRLTADSWCEAMKRMDKRDRRN